MKRFVLGLIQISIAVSLFASPVDIQIARNIATNAYYQKVNLFLKPVGINDIQISEYFEIKKDGETMLYAFNFSNFGYIIISADDAMTPVIGYSFESQYNPTNTVDNFTSWLSGRAGAVKFSKENNLVATPEIKSNWNNFSNLSNLSLKGGGKYVEPLLMSTWDQPNPYNYYCPPRTTQPNSQGKALVGCVATAMSQIMLYWRYPHQGSGSHSYNCPPVGTLSANFGETIYDWDGMLDNSIKVNLPMALISFHAGVSVDMDYFDAGGSGAYSSDVPYAMKTYFNYDISIQYLSKSNYQWSAWRQYIEDDLDLLRPVYYAGRDGSGSTSSGHAFVLDGYQSDGTYHFNFGWSGSGNGWFDIQDPAGYEWYYQQQMVRNIFPSDATYPYGCTPDYVTTDLVGSITDGSGPQENYDQNANCSWLIDPQTANDSVTKIQLSFVVLDTESDDIITIYDGETTSAPVLGTYSGNPATMPPAVLSTGNKMLIVFTADGDATTASGFRVEYFTYLPAWCSGNTILNSTSGVLDDGSGSWYYKNQTNCTWKIQPEWASDLTLTFTEFDTEEDLDVVKIYDASNNQLLATYSGQYTAGNMPEPITVPSGKIFISFQSDGAVNRPGWTAEWEIANTSVDEQVAGFDQLMVYPNPAENLLNISFLVEENQSLEVRLISATGKVIYSENAKDFSGYYVNTIDLSGFSKGVYFLSLTNDNGTVNKKVVVK
jgi:hypothetical protein